MKNPNISSSNKEEEDVTRRIESEKPPEDDCCPICFGNFSIPCKTNCGHWFCASCILQLWYYRSTLQRCKCPICSCLISKLVPEASLHVQQEEDVIELLKKIRRYNHLYISGAYGVFLKILALPLLTRRIFQALMDTLMDPDQVRLNYYLMRILAEDLESGDCLTSVLLPWWPFSFWPAYTVGGCFVVVRDGWLFYQYTLTESLRQLTGKSLL